MAEAIQESAGCEELAQAMSVVLRQLLCTFGCHTFPDSQLNKAFLRIVAGAFRDKVEDLAEQGGG